MARKILGIPFFRGLAASFARRIRSSLAALFGFAEAKDVDALAKFVVDVSFTEDVIQGISSRHKAAAAKRLTDKGVRAPAALFDFGVDKYLAERVAANVKLITALSEETRAKLTELTLRSVTAPGFDFKAELQRIGKFSDNRARLIARDQTSKIQSQLHQQRMQNLGVVEYRWRTSGDERVRQSHSDNNGKIFRWDKPPSTGHPGDDIQCRCTAEAIIPDSLF